MKNITASFRGVFALCLFSGLLLDLFLQPTAVFAAYHFSNYKAQPPIHVYSTKSAKPSGITPAEIKKAYGLPASGGSGTIILIGAYDSPTLESDLGIFSQQFDLPACSTTNGCFEKHPMTTGIKSNSGWAMETALDVEWAHAIAPTAKIVLVEAPTPSGANLLKAIDYAAALPDAVAISMSFGGAEFPEETTLDSHFVSKNGAVFFAASGDNGSGASWPAASPKVVGVGGTTLHLQKDGSLQNETAWAGSGGGVSVYETEPSYQKSYSIPRANGMRAIPDVSYNADPAAGFPIYKGGNKTGGWYRVGGTSAGAPQWAAIQALGHSVSLSRLYNDKSSFGHASFFQDIVSGLNGTCGYYCEARSHYDYVTGLGSPRTSKF